MRLLAIIFISLVFTCYNNENTSLLSDYLYPIDSLKTPKVFVFHRMDNPLIKARDCFQTYRKGSELYLRKFSIGEGRRDSSIFIIKDGSRVLQEKYSIHKKNSEERVAKHKILSISSNGNRYELKLEVVSPFNPDIITKSKMIAICDSTMVHNVMGEDLSCIREKYFSEYTISNNLVKLFSITNEVTGDVIYAKHLGVVYYSVETKDTGEVYRWELESIVNYDNRMN